MSINISLKKGLDLKLAGEIEDFTPRKIEVDKCAVIPDDFTGFLPKPDVHEGDVVKIGSPLLHDKIHEDLKIVSPVAGRVKAIVRGERRKIERVEIEADGPQEALGFDISNLSDPRKILVLLQQSGMMARMRQRPYDIVPNPDVTPRDIFVTVIDSAPLALDMAATLKGKEKELKAAVAMLARLTKGKVYVACRPGAIADIPGAEMVTVNGPHPSGNAGVIIANVAPVNKGETVWTLDGVTLAKIGTLALTGNVDSSTLTGVCGSEIARPYVALTTEGAPVSALLAGDVDNDKRHHRIISGNVLTGSAVAADGYLRFPGVSSR